MARGTAPCHRKDLHNKASPEAEENPLQSYHSQKDISEITALLTEILTETYQEPDNRPVTTAPAKAEMVSTFYEETAPNEGIGLQKSLEYFRDQVLPHSVKTWHPLFLNQMFAGASFPSIVGDLMASMMNPTLATFEMSPAGTIIERSVAAWMANMLGMPRGSSGIFLPGGSISNMMALAVAKHLRLGPELANTGLVGLDQKPAILCSEASHYSIANAGGLLGFGKDQVIKVATNASNEMLVEDFEAKIAWAKEQGMRPFAAVITMGLTVTGCFDPLKELVPICQANDLHIHVDAAFGGGISLTDEGAEVLAGIEQADSVIWDCHKWMHVPLASTVLLVPKIGVLKQVFSSGADYLYHEQDEIEDLGDDLGHYTPLCGKRFDALRTWLLFKAYGEQHFRDLANSRMKTTRDIAALINAAPDFKLSYEPRSPLICWRYIPESMKDASDAELSDLQRKIRETIKKRGLAFFNMATLKGGKHFRAVLVNPLAEADHFYRILEDIRKVASEILTTH